jgi:hypothetical protein
MTSPLEVWSARWGIAAAVLWARRPGASFGIKHVPIVDISFMMTHWSG